MSRPPRRVSAAEDQKILSPGLYVTATPIGNLRDITLRALDALAACDLILCEDTRVTKKLLNVYGITKPVQAYHDHNAAKLRPRILKRLGAGERICLVSDAGTPLIADPGYRLVGECAARGIAVTTLPGASSPIAALSVAGLPTDRFLFAGFIPARAAPRRRFLGDLAKVDATLVLLETGRRLGPCLRDMSDIMGDRLAVIARELTKKFEEVRRDHLGALAASYAEAAPPKGELVVMLGPPQASPSTAENVETIVKRAAAALPDMTTRQAAAAIAGEFNLPKRAVYASLLALKKGKGS